MGEKTDWNCWFRMSALSVVSENILPLDCNGGILCESFLECFKSVNNFLVLGGLCMVLPVSVVIPRISSI